MSTQTEVFYLMTPMAYRVMEAQHLRQSEMLLSAPFSHLTRYGAAWFMQEAETVQQGRMSPVCLPPMQNWLAIVCLAR